MYRTRMRLCRTHKGEVVPEGHPEAAYLLYPAGRDVPDTEAKRLNLAKVEKDAMTEKQEPDEKPDEKAVTREDIDVKAIERPPEAKAVTRTKR